MNKRETKWPNCRRLLTENRSLKAKVRSLEQRIERLEKTLRQSKRQATPFSRNKEGRRRKAKGSPGRKPGKGAFKRREPPPESELKSVRVPLGQCPECGGALQQRKRHEQIQSDIPPVRPAHRRFLTQSGYCPRCKRRFHSRHPDQSSVATGAAGVTIGPNARAIAAEMKHRLGVSYEKIAEMFSTVFGFKVSRSGLCRSGRRLAQKARPIYEDLKEALRRSPGVHSDETGWRIGTLPTWLWALVSRRVTLYTIRRSRGHEVVTDVLGPDFEGVLHSDCFSAYESKDLNGWTQQRCLAHLCHELSELQQSKTRGAVRFPRNVLSVLRDAMGLGRGKADLSAAEFEQKLHRLHHRLDRLISAQRNFTDPDNARIAARLRKQRDRLFTFLTHRGAEPTNNRAERAIRPAVVARKMGGGNKTRTGAETHAILASVLATAKGLGIGTVDYLRTIASCRGRPPPLLPAAA